jgi:hypothetical protein
MTDAWAVVLSGAVGGLLTLAGSALTELLGHRREDRRLTFEKTQADLTALAALYEDTIYNIERNARTTERGTDEDLTNVVRCLARLRLVSTPEIRKQYIATATALSAWANEQRQARPTGGSGITLISSTQSVHEKRAKEFFPAFEKSFETLQAMMRDHLDGTIDPA